MDGCSPLWPLLEGVGVEREELQRSGFIIGRRIDVFGGGEDGLILKKEVLCCWLVGWLFVCLFG